MKLVNWSQGTYRWGGKRTRVYVENPGPQPRIRWQIDRARAQELQQRLERHFPEPIITEAWEEFLLTLAELGIIMK